jgi:hypothetical protein
MTLGVRIVSIPENLSWYKDHTACLRLLYAFWWSDPMPSGGCLWSFDIVLLVSSFHQTPQLGLDQSRYWARSSENIYRLNVGYTYYQIEGMKIESKYSLEVVRQQNECTSMLPIQALNTLFSIWIGHLFTLFSFIISRSMKPMWQYPFLRHSFTFILHGKKKEGMRKHISNWAII